jgi:hypothetical protein
MLSMYYVAACPSHFACILVPSGLATCYVTVVAALLDRDLSEYLGHDGRMTPRVR